MAIVSVETGTFQNDSGSSMITTNRFGENAFMNFSPYQNRCNNTSLEFIFVIMNVQLLIPKAEINFLVLSRSRLERCHQDCSNKIKINSVISTQCT